MNANIKASQQQDADFDKLQTQQQQTDAQFREAGAAGALLLPNVRSSIEHNAAVSARLTESIRKKIQSMQDSGKSDTGIAIEGKQSVTDGNQGNGSTLTDEQRQKVEELLAQNAQSTRQEWIVTDTATGVIRRNVLTCKTLVRGLTSSKLSTGMPACFR